jgi:hypothetical protein
MTSPADAIRDAVQSVTREWAKQRKAEERNRNAIFNRRLRLLRSERVTLREAAFEVMEKSYLRASDNSRLPTKPRQIMYVARPHILEMTGDRVLNSSYFSQTLLIDYMEEYDYDHWDIIWDARGHFSRSAHWKSGNISVSARPSEHQAATSIWISRFRQAVPNTGSATYSLSRRKASTQS